MEIPLIIHQSSVDQRSLSADAGEHLRKNGQSVITLQGNEEG